MGAALSDDITVHDCLCAFEIASEYVVLADKREEMAAIQVLAEELLNWAAQQASAQRRAFDAANACNWPVSIEEPKK